MEEREMAYEVRGIRRVVESGLAMAVLFMLLPFAGVSCAGADSEVSEDALASPGSRVLRVGWPGLQEDIQTLNPLVYTTAAEYMVIWPCYSSLLTRDVDGNLMGDLATKWSLSADGLTWHFEIVQTAMWFDKTTYPDPQVQLTVRDIIFTYWLVQNTTNCALSHLFPDLPDAGGRPIEAMGAVGDYEMWVKIRAPYAPLMNALSSIPILPEYIWSGRAWDWRNYDATYPPVVGSGPWYYGLGSGPSSGYAELLRSPTWFGTEEYGWQLHANRLLLVSESEDSNIANYKSGNTDIITLPTPSQFLDPTLPGEKWQSSQGFVFEFNMNQLTEENRDLFDIGRAGDYNNQLLLDPVVKLALQMSVDKEEFVAEALQGLGSPADTLMPEVSPWRYDYGGPSAPPDEAEIPYDPAAARMMLYAHGWSHRLDGSEILPSAPDFLTYYPLSRAVGGVATETLQFRYITPNTDSYFMIGAKLIEQDAAGAGIDLLYSAQSAGAINEAWYMADYDTWLWSWEFTPMSEPSSDVMFLLTTDAITVWSDVYWSNETYDSLFRESISEMSPSYRKLILDEMQRMAYLHSGCWPVAWLDTLYAAQSVVPDCWLNYGNWSESYPLSVDSGYPWLFTRMYPADNPAPQITGWNQYYEGMPTAPVQFDATVVDDGPQSALEYQWNFGDGTKSGWLDSPAVGHLYTSKGVYFAWLMVREADTPDGFITSDRAIVQIYYSQTAPHDLNFTVEPSDPDNGTQVYLNGTALDDDGDQLTYSWAFGDGFTAEGQNVTHQFMVGSWTYNVTMYVDDGYLGPQERPVSLSREVFVGENHPPTLTVYVYTEGRPGIPQNYTVIAGDPDERDRLRFTWDWGDGSALSVTEVPWQTHTYHSQGIYLLEVFCDDLTGLQHHNVSDTGWVYVFSSNKAPVINYFAASNLTPLTEQDVEFTALATDVNENTLLYTFYFGDGALIQIAAEQGSYVLANHSYAYPGSYEAYLTVWDYQAPPVTSGLISIEVAQGNQAPVVDPFSAVIATVGLEEAFLASATDPDGDVLIFTWDFRDGSDLAVGNPVTHTYAVSSGEFGMLYTVHVDDGNGHNVSVNGVAYVNWLPLIEEPLHDLYVVALEENEYTVMVSDNDSDELVVTWDFGDGNIMVGQTVQYAYQMVAVPTEYTLTVYVDDGYNDTEVTHNVSSSVVATVLAAPDTVPPVADAGPDQIVMAGDLVTFDGSGSTDDVGIVSWVWTFMWEGYPVTLEGEIVTFLFDQMCDVIVTLTVTDSGGNSDTDEMIVHVGDWGIPELPMVALPVIGTIVMIGVLFALRRRKDL